MAYLEVKINRTIPASLVTILNEVRGNKTAEVGVCNGTLAVKIDVPDDSVGEIELPKFIEDVETVIKYVFPLDSELVVETDVYAH